MDDLIVFIVAFRIDHDMISIIQLLYGFTECGKDPGIMVYGNAVCVAED